MAFYYFDASALVKYYVAEPGSAWVRQLIDAQDPESAQVQHNILLVEITHVEVAAGLAAITRVGRIRRSERDRAYLHFISQFTQRYSIIPLAREDLPTAAELTQRHPLKAYDAVQLAVALRYSQRLTNHQLTVTFVSGDNTLLAAAQAEALITDNPFSHISADDTPA